MLSYGVRSSPSWEPIELYATLAYSPANTTVKLSWQLQQALPFV